jgi:signal transduction histidine kinase
VRHPGRAADPDLRAFREPPEGGIGLGLFLSQSFIRRWGGEIVIESEPGRGSTFEIRLPPAASGVESEGTP